jgi:hypothetical protein
MWTLQWGDNKAAYAHNITDIMPLCWRATSIHIDIQYTNGTNRRTFGAETKPEYFKLSHSGA